LHDNYSEIVKNADKEIMYSGVWGLALVESEFGAL